MAFLKLSILVIASVEKGLSCPTLVSSKLPESLYKKQELLLLYTELPKLQLLLL